MKKTFKDFNEYDQWKSREGIQFYLACFFILTLALMIVLLATVARADEINLTAIKMIESSNNTFAYNKSSGAVGLYQITDICLQDYNNYHSRQYSLDDMYNPIFSEEVARWYLLKRIPQMLRHYGAEVTIDNILISYNAGISYVVKNKDVPRETKDYLVKYKNMIGVK